MYRYPINFGQQQAMISLEMQYLLLNEDIYILGIGSDYVIRCLSNIYTRSRLWGYTVCLITGGHDDEVINYYRNFIQYYSTTNC